MNKVKSWDADSDIDWSQWIDTEIPDGVDNLKDPDYLPPNEEGIGQNSNLASWTGRKYNLRSRCRWFVLFSGDKFIQTIIKYIFTNGTDFGSFLNQSVYTLSELTRTKCSFYRCMNLHMQRLDYLHFCYQLHRKRSKYECNPFSFSGHLKNLKDDIDCLPYRAKVVHSVKPCGALSYVYKTSLTRISRFSLA